MCLQGSGRLPGGVFHDGLRQVHHFDAVGTQVACTADGSMLERSGLDPLTRDYIPTQLVADARYCLSCGPGLRTSCNGSTMRRGIWY